MNLFTGIGLGLGIASTVFTAIGGEQQRVKDNEQIENEIENKLSEKANEETK